MTAPLAPERCSCMRSNRVGNRWLPIEKSHALPRRDHLSTTFAPKATPRFGVEQDVHDGMLRSRLVSPLDGIVFGR